MKRKFLSLFVAIVALIILGSVGSGSQASYIRVASGQNNQWEQIDRPDFSFSYPAGWRITEFSDSTYSGAKANDVTGRQEMGILFRRGFNNSPDILNQCASVDKILDSYYQDNFSRFATGTNQYPYTTVTHDDFKPGLLGGKSTWVSIVHVEAYKNPVTIETWVNAVPRATGIYIVSYQHPSEPMQVSEPLRQAFAKSIVFKAKPLDRKAYCNYLGQ